MKDVCGIDDTSYLVFEKPVRLRESDGRIHTRKIDVYVPSSRIVIEMKGSSIDLTKKGQQSGGDFLTPFEQAKRYMDNIPHNQQGRYIITSNFREIRLYDLNNEIPEDKPIIIALKNLTESFPALSCLFGHENAERDIIKEEELSAKAGELIGGLYDELKKLYPSSVDEKLISKSLNVLCVRFVFLFYAEDAGLFNTDEKLFQNLVANTPASYLADKLRALFRVLNTKNDDPMRGLETAELRAFPYTNGGLFADTEILVPQMSESVKNFIAHEAAEFDWSGISPTIFGAMFESTINARERHENGMHYTSIANIHKAIDPLFLDDLTHEVEELEQQRRLLESQRLHGLTDRDIAVLTQKVENFQDKLAKIRILDPACGSGNFLTESYLSLRRLENRALKVKEGNQISFSLFDDDSSENPIKVRIDQFYGIEISGFACDVARTALWIAEAQMYDETKSIVIGMKESFLPLTSNHNIHSTNALKADWNDIVEKRRLSYIVGNPPFLGARVMSPEQKKEALSVFHGLKGAGNLDYVTCWFIKAAQYIQHTDIKCAFVSTNSITQGEQVALLWKPLMNSFNIDIIFAHKSFEWVNEATDQAHVHVVIIGFCYGDYYGEKLLFSGNDAKKVSNINGYLADADNFFVENRTKPLCRVPEIGIGNKPIDGGNYLFTQKEMEDFLKQEPKAKKYFHKWYGATEFISRKPRYCLLLKDCSQAELLQMPKCLERVRAVRDFRLRSKSAGTRKIAKTPTKFHVTNIPKEHYIVIPETSSSRRKYVPIGFLSYPDLCSNAVRIMPNATLYYFGILTSNVHMFWMKTVCGRLGSGYRYSKDIVYNNFPWPNITENQKSKIEETARRILCAREEYPGISYQKLYDPELEWMFPKLKEAHEANDRAVMEAYGFNEKMTEDDIVAELMKMYQNKASESN